MKIKTITCHDVYNVGASLQAYALQEYLIQLGHDVEIIDYKPDYLRHYRLWWVPNPKFDKPILRELYNLAKLPGRLKLRLFDPRKKVFDHFTSDYLKLTNREYASNMELQQNPPEADVYIAGSDQIWNPVFQNGKDPAFFLNFGSDQIKRISYAASFSVDAVTGHDKSNMQNWLKSLDSISVRETSGLSVLKSLGFEGIQVCDPVFLLSDEKWGSIAMEIAIPAKYLLVYDFEQNDSIRELSHNIAQKDDLKIVSIFPMEEADIVMSKVGPLEFLYLMIHASFVVSNSFHATAFSLIFHKPFVVLNRQEKINTRMRDLLELVDMQEFLINDVMDYTNMGLYDWDRSDCAIKEMQSSANDYLRII